MPLLSRLTLALLPLLLLPACDRITHTRAQNAYERGLRKEQEGDLPGAIAEFSQALSRDPKHLDAYIRRAACRGQSGELDTALADIDAAITLDPRSATALTTRGAILMQRREPQAALADYDRAIALDPSSAWAYQNRGFLKRMRHEYEGALADFNQALTLNPNNATVLENRGALLQDRADLPGALADFDRAVRLAPGRASAHAGRGAVKAQAGDVKGAMADFDRALDLDDNAAFTYRARGQLHMKLAQWQEALRDFRASCQISTAEQDYPHLFMWICRAHTAGPADPDTNAGLTAYMKSRPAATAGDWVSKIASHLLGSLPEAALLKAAADTPDKAIATGQLCEAWYYIGIKKSLTGDHAGATAAFQKCLGTGVAGFVEYDLARAELDRTPKAPR